MIGISVNLNFFVTSINDLKNEIAKIQRCADATGIVVKTVTAKNISWSVIATLLRKLFSNLAEAALLNFDNMFVAHYF